MIYAKKYYKLLIFFGIFLALIIFSTITFFPQKKESPVRHKFTNKLIQEKSPYLLQHAHNPVEWHPWGETALAKAKKEDKPIFLSIGYSTCHWCHVMAHESFEDEETAKILNEYFVPIKVDREERPDLDNIYMTAVTALTGSGGWPLSVFLTSDKKPFFGGTYFPPQARWGAPGFKDVLLSIHNSWQTQRREILESGQSITQALQERSSVRRSEKIDLNVQLLRGGYQELAANYDSRFGGFGQAPKFPMGHSLSFLLRYWKRSPEPPALAMVEKTLTAMAQGGMYDQLGGGFHRYSTDQIWQVPHFEKMLYDQAILVRAYLESYQATGEEFYARIARETLDYVLRDMQAKQGGFFSAEDADSLESAHAEEKKEGAFYVWRAAEIKAVLAAEEAEIFAYYFGIEENGNAQVDPHGEFVGKNILFAAHPLEESAQKFHKTPAEIEKIIQQARQKLYAVRGQRPRPHLDDKILVDWNGLFISSLAFAASVLEEPRYRQAAEKAADFILQNLVDPKGRLLHRFRDGEAAILGTIEDYAFFIHGLLDLYQATFTVRYFKEARRLAEEMLCLFWDEEPGGFFFTATDSETLLFRQKEVYDGAIPSGNSVAALDLIRLARMTGEENFAAKAEALFQFFGMEILQRPSAYTQALIALDFALGPAREIVIAADDSGDPKAKSMIRTIRSFFLPNAVMLFRPTADQKLRDLIALAPFVEQQVPLHGQPTAYVCENHVCQLPTNSNEQLKELLRN